MKTLITILAITSATALPGRAQVGQPPAAAPTALTEPTSGPSTTAYAPVERGRDHTTWERYRFEKNRTGRIFVQTNRVVELETGSRYLQNGRWLESTEDIQLVENGAVATNGPHKVGFTADISSRVPVAVTTPDNTTLKIRPLGLAYYDFHADKYVVIAELKAAEGMVLGNNQVIYPQAFTDFKVDVRYTYKKSGLEQDIILRQRPPLPEAYGLNPDTTWLLALTEFIDPPSDVQVNRQIRRGWKKSTVDKVIRIGGMSIGQGTAFGLGLGKSRRAGVPVQKHWTVMDGRTILVEEVSFRRIVPQLRNLQASAQPAPGSAAGSTRHLASKTLLLPPLHLASATSTAPMQVASVAPQEEGLVLDYPLESGSDIVLQADHTYLVTNTVNLNNVVIEGGTVVKFARGASINLFGTVQCLTAPYRPAFFTAVDDNSVGETIPGSSGIPTGTYADCALSGVSGDLSYLNIRFANEAIYCVNNTYTLSHSQVLGCNSGLHNEYADFLNCNLLISYVGVPYCGSYFNGRVEHLTCDNAYYLVQDWDIGYWVDCGTSGTTPSSTLTLVNSLTAVILNGYGEIPVATDHVRDGVVFQAAGPGAHYLPPDSPCRDAGTTDIQPALADALKTKTTYAPVVYSNVVFSADTTLGPQAQRDTDTPDLGYHYDPIDFAFKWTRVTNATLRLLPHTSIATFGPYGIALWAGSKLVSEGTPTSLNHIARYNMVQEYASTNWDGTGASVLGDWNGGAPSSASCRLTDWSMPAQDGPHFQTSLQAMVNAFSDCQFHGGRFQITDPGIGITNCLFERVNTTISDDNGADVSPVIRNCLFLGGKATLTHNNSDTWLFRDSVFDQTDIVQDGAVSNACNAYRTAATRLQPTNTTDKVVTNFNWQTSWLGNYYLPSDSPLIDHGSTTANLVSLYHYTTQTNQAKEVSSVVDIGFHYVAVDASGNPIDTDGDGTPDYLEDRNGDGDGTNDPTSWLQYNSPNGLTSGNGLQVFTPLR
jgi:hypothetical protein